MFNRILRMGTRKKQKNTAAIGGAVSVAAVLGGLITWYTAKRRRNSREENFDFELDDEESQH